MIASIHSYYIVTSHYLINHNCRHALIPLLPLLLLLYTINVDVALLIVEAHVSYDRC